MSLDREKAPIVVAGSTSHVEPIMRVRVIDFDMPFGSMVMLMVKWTIAAVPALIILVILGALLAGLFSGLV